MFPAFRPWCLGLHVALALMFTVASTVVSIEPAGAQQFSTSENDPVKASRDELVAAHTFSLNRVGSRLASELGMSPEQQELWLTDFIHQQIGFGTIESDAQPASFVDVMRSGGGAIRVYLDALHRGFSIAEGELVVVGNSAEVRQVQHALETIEQFGVRQIVLQTHVLRDSDQNIESLEIPWMQVESPISVSQAPAETKHTSSEECPAIKSGKTLVDLYVERTQVGEEKLQPPPPGASGATWATADSIVHRATPVLYSLLAGDEYERVMERVRKKGSIQRVISPSVVVYSGQVAAINNTVERSFVTGIRPVTEQDSENRPVAFSPTVRVYAEGTRMRFLPKLLQGRELDLGCELEVCKILDVDKLNLPHPNGEGVFTVQVPEVATTQYRSELRVPVDFALAVKFFEKDRSGNRDAMLVLCRCSLRDIEVPEHAALRVESRQVK